MTSRGASALVRTLWRTLGGAAAEIRVVVEVAAERGVGCFAVGGPVRDLLLGRPIADVDVLLTDALEQVALESARRLAGAARLRPEFLTATLRTPSGRIDLSRTRRERYTRPGALPRVAPGSLEEDLARRDFSIHAMALPLEAGTGARLLDPQGGLRDLRARRVRVLHARSFLDDPTRLWRAARFCGRLGFELETETARLARAATRGGALDTVSGDRIAHEVEKLAGEPGAARAVETGRALGFFHAVESGWRPASAARGTLARLECARRDPPWPGAASGEVARAAGLRALFLGTAAPARGRALERLGYRGRRRGSIEEDLAALAKARRALARPLSPGALDAALAGASEAVLLLLAYAEPPRVRAAVRRFARDLQRSPAPLGGEAAAALGARGPEIGALLRAARRRALDGHPADEAWARRWLERRRRLG